MILGRVLGLVVADAHQRQFHLQRRGADQARELRLGADLVRHQIEKPDLQRTDVLAQRRPLVHHGHALADEYLVGGELIGNLDRHLRKLQNKKTGGDIATGLNGFASDGPLASCLTWLQADRPNHHGTWQIF